MSVVDCRLGHHFEAVVQLRLLDFIFSCEVVSCDQNGVFFQHLFAQSRKFLFDNDFLVLERILVNCVALQRIFFEQFVFLFNPVLLRQLRDGFNWFGLEVLRLSNLPNHQLPFMFDKVLDFLLKMPLSVLNHFLKQLVVATSPR